MSLTIPDEVLHAAGLSESEARLEIACRLFDAEKLSLWPAARWAGLSRSEFEEALAHRGIAIYRPKPEEVVAEVEAMRSLLKTSHAADCQ